MANISDVIANLKTAVANTQATATNNANTTSGTQTQTQSTTTNVEQNTTGTNTTTPTTTSPSTTATATTATQGDASTSTAVSTPATNTASGTTTVATTTAATAISPALSEELYTSNPQFKDYATKSGFTVQTLDGKTYVNNTVVDWAKIGMKLTNGVLTGTKAQYDQLLQQVKNSGYYSGESFTEFATNAGYKVSRSYDGNYILINGIPVDPTLYDSMTKLNGSWVGKTETYQEMIAEAMSPTKADPDYLASTEFADYARKKGYLITGNFAGLKLNVNGFRVDMKYYPGLKLVNGKVVGDEATYRQIIQDSYIYEHQDMISYYTKKGLKVKTDENGYIAISKDGVKWSAIHAPYWQNIEGEMRTVTGQWYASAAVFDAAAQEALNRSDYDLETYARIIGYDVTRNTTTGNLVIAGKEIPGTNLTDKLAAGTAKYYTSLILVGGKYVGSEALYRQILTDLQTRSDTTLNDYASNNNSTVTIMNDKIYINGSLVDTTGTTLQIVNGTVYGSEGDYQKVIAKANEGYTYTSPYEDQINTALEEIKNFEAYQTPQETLDQINSLMDSAKAKFNYDPTQDSALKTAQKEAERVVRETAGSKGLLYSSGTVATAARKAGELIPTYEQQSYNRWADQKNREANLLNTIMEWDNMEAQRNVDKLNLLKTKFDTVMSMDSKNLEKFKILLEQRYEDRKYALDLESLNIEQQQAALDLAWKRVESLGYVDQQASVVLGVPVGTKASWAQQAALEHEYSLQQLAKQNEYTIAQMNSQYALDKSLTEYKTYLEECAQIRNLNRTYGMEYSLQQQQFQNDLYIARNY